MPLVVRAYGAFFTAQNTRANNCHEPSPACIPSFDQLLINERTKAKGAAIFSSEFRGFGASCFGSAKQRGCGAGGASLTAHGGRRKSGAKINGCRDDGWAARRGALHSDRTVGMSVPIFPPSVHFFFFADNKSKSPREGRSARPAEDLRGFARGIPFGFTYLSLGERRQKREEQGKETRNVTYRRMIYYRLVARSLLKSVFHIRQQHPRRLPAACTRLCTALLLLSLEDAKRKREEERRKKGEGGTRAPSGGGGSVKDATSYRNRASLNFPKVRLDIFQSVRCLKSLLAVVDVVASASEVTRAVL